MGRLGSESLLITHRLKSGTSSCKILNKGNKMKFKFELEEYGVTHTVQGDLDEWVTYGETRIRTGVGIPQMSCLQSITDVASTPIISCGGIRYPGDVAKALGVGASSVILGSMFSGTKETPGDIQHFGKYGNRHKMKIYHGSASDVQKTMSSAELNNIEGTATMVSYKGSVEEIVNEIMDGVRSAMSYVGSESIHKFYLDTEFVQITTNGLQEAMPHLL